MSSPAVLSEEAGNGDPASGNVGGSESKVQRGVTVAETGSQLAPDVSGDAGFGGLVPPLLPGGDGITGSVDPDSAISRLEPAYRMEAEPVAIESVTLAEDSGLLAKPQRQKRSLNSKGTPITEEAVKWLNLVRAIGKHTVEGVAEGGSLVEVMENSPWEFLLLVLPPWFQQPPPSGLSESPPSRLVVMLSLRVWGRTNSESLGPGFPESGCIPDGIGRFLDEKWC